MKTFLQLAALSLLLVSPAVAGVGTPYGARDPATCPVRNVPTSGPPSPEQVARYLACELERESSMNLYLLSNVKVQVARRPRPYDVRHDSADQVDVTAPVYDIQGSFLKYQCPLKTSYDGEHFPGRHCSYSNQSNASGLCWQTTYGEWHCRMIDTMHLQNSVEHVPPPD